MKMKSTKESYEKADVKVVLFEFSDIIATSGGNWGNGSGAMDGGEGGGWDVN